MKYTTYIQNTLASYLILENMFHYIVTHQFIWLYYVKNDN